MGGAQSSKFLVAVNFANGASADDCKKIFDYFDADKNGVLDTAESRRFLAELCRHKKLSDNVDEFVNQMMERLDTDKDGRLCWGELITQEFFAEEQPGSMHRRARSMSDSARQSKPQPSPSLARTPRADTPNVPPIPASAFAKALPPLPNSPQFTPSSATPKIPPLPRKSFSYSNTTPPPPSTTAPPSPPESSLLTDSKPFPPPPLLHRNSQHLTVLDPDNPRVPRALTPTELPTLPPPPPPPSRVTSRAHPPVPSPPLATPILGCSSTPPCPSLSPSSSPYFSPLSAPRLPCSRTSSSSSTSSSCSTSPSSSSSSTSCSPLFSSSSASCSPFFSSSSAASPSPSSASSASSSSFSFSSASIPHSSHPSGRFAASPPLGFRRTPRPPPSSPLPANTVNFHRYHRHPGPPPQHPSSFELPPPLYKKRSPPPPPESSPMDVNVKPSSEIPRLDAVLREDSLTEKERRLHTQEQRLQAAEREVHRRERAVEARERAVEDKHRELLQLEERLIKQQEAGPGLSSNQEDIPSDKKMQLTRQKVAQEIMVTEDSYVNGLLKLGTHFGTPAQALLAKEDYDAIFGSLAQALPINMALLEDLKLRLAHYNDETTIGDLFIKFAPYFKLYAAYIGGHEKALNLITSLCAKNKAFRSLLEKGSKTAGCTLQSCLILPVQRIPRYELLLSEMLKNTPPDHPDRAKLLQALPQIKNAATFLDTSISGADSAAELLSVQHSLVNCPDLLRPGRTLLHRGVLSRIHRGQDTKKFELILMTDLIIFTNFHREGLNQGRARGNSGQHKIKGMIVIDSQFFVQSISPVDLLDERDENEARSRSRSPHSSMSADSEALRHLFRMVSGSSGQSDWACDSELERTTWLEMLQKAAKLRHQVLDKPPDNLAGGVQLTLVSPAEEPHDITLLWLPYRPLDPVGGSLDVRVWWEETTAQVHVMLVEAHDLRTEGDTYITLSAYSVMESEALALHLAAHQRMERGRRSKPDTDKKTPPRWTSKSKIAKRAWWGQDFTFSLTPTERAAKGRQLLRLEVWEWHQVERDVCLGQLTIDLGTITSFSSSEKAPLAYTCVPEPPQSTSLIRSQSIRALSPVALKRLAPEDRERFCYELRPQASLAGVPGRFFWVNAGTCLLKQEKSFSSGQVVEVIMGSNRVKHETPFSIVLRDSDDAPRKNGARQYLMQMCFRTPPAVVEYWCEQLTQVVPLVRVVSRWEEKHSCRMYAPTLWQKGDHCRYCGFSRRSH